MSYVSVAGAVVLEMLCSVVLVNGLSGKGGRIPRVKAAVFVAAATAYVLSVPAGWVNGCYLLTLLYVKAGYGSGWGESAVTVVLSLVVGGLAELVCFFPFVFLFDERWTDCRAALASLVLCIVLSGRFPLWRLGEWCRKREAWYVAVVAFSLVVMVSKVTSYHMTLELGAGDYVSLVLCIVLVWMLSLRLMRYHYEEKARKRYYDAFCSVIGQIRRRQHRFKNQLDTVYSMHGLYHDYGTLVEEQRKYLGKLADCEMPSDVLVLGNPVVVAHVYGKVSEAQEAGLRLRMRLRCSLEGCGIGDIEMVEILGTLFDNAVEDMEARGEREYLVFEAEERADGEGYVVRVANPHERLGGTEIWRMFGNGYSTKGEGRGIGLYHVRKLVKRNGADLVAENREIEGRNYLCFSLVTGRNTPPA